MGTISKREYLLAVALRRLMKGSSEFMGNYAEGVPDSLHEAWVDADSLLKRLYPELVRDLFSEVKK